jgi:hypothetical protein
MIILFLNNYDLLEPFKDRSSFELCNNSVHTSKETHFISTTIINWLMSFGEIITVNNFEIFSSILKLVHC